MINTREIALTDLLDSVIDHLLIPLADVWHGGRSGVIRSQRVTRDVVREPHEIFEFRVIFLLF